MGVDIHVYVCKLNKEDNLYHELVLYRKREEEEKTGYNYETGESYPIDDPYIKVRAWDGRNSEMFEGIKNGDDVDGYGEFPGHLLNIVSLAPELREEINKYINVPGCFDFREVPFDSFALYLKEHPTVTDYDYDSDKWDDYIESHNGERPQKTNPLKYLYESCTTYADLAERFGHWETYWQDYKLVYWFDC